MTDPSSTTPRADALIGHVEHLRCSGSSLFVAGWLLHRSQPIVALELRSTTGDELWSAQYGSLRADVMAAWRHSAHGAAAPAWARYSGFSVIGPAPANMSKGLLLRARLADGAVIDWPVDARLLTDADAAAAWGGRRAKMLRSLLTKAWQYLRAGRWAELGPAARRVWRDRPRSSAAALAALRARMRTASRLVWVIDHAMGGGANQFRARHIAQLQSEGAEVLLLAFHLPTLSPFVVLHAADAAGERHALDGIHAVFELWAAAPPRHVYLNNLVSFDAPQSWVERLGQALSDSPATGLTLFVHDYHALCPSHTLLDADGRYCDVPPALSVCHACLQRHREPFVRQAGQSDMASWRQAWAGLIERADEVVGFAPSPLALMERVHPTVRSKRIVRPHSMAYFEAVRRPRIDRAAAPVLAIVGEIAAHKGADVVLGLADAIDTARHPMRLVVIGELRHQHARLPACLHVTGRYQAEQLPDLIERHGVNAALFPSIWPETFSYVVHELLILGLPLAVFDLGAQADALANPALGVRLPLCSGAELLARLDQAYETWRTAKDVSTGGFNSSDAARSP